VCYDALAVAWHLPCLLGMFALVYARELPDASSLMAEGFRQALVLDRWMLAGIADRLLNPPVDNAEVLLASVPRRVTHLVDLGRLLERRGRPAAAVAAFETALAIASGPAERAEVRLAHGQVLLRRKDVGRALAELRQALVLAPKSPDVFAALGEAYEAASAVSRGGAPRAEVRRDSGSRRRAPAVRTDARAWL
jgi:predicted Zn-dependent protease